MLNLVEPHCLKCLVQVEVDVPDWVVVRAKKLVRHARFYNEDVARQGVPLLEAPMPPC